MTIGMHPCARALPYVAPPPPLSHTLHTSGMFECEEMDKMIA